MTHTMSVKLLQVTSRVLAGNPWGDPTARTLHVIAPDTNDGPLPMIWWLPGYSGYPEAALAHDPWNEGLLQRVRRLFASGALPPCRIAVVDAFTALGGAQYLDSTATGAYETHVVEELVPAAAAAFPTTAHAIAGKSSGGFGALWLSWRHPQVFRAAACHSGDMAFDLTYQPHFPALGAALQKYGGVEGLVQAFLESRDKRGSFFDPICTLCMAACYSPGVSEPRGIRLPFDPHTLALRDDVWARWRSFDPVVYSRRPEVQAGWKALKLLWLDCGLQDQYGLGWGLRQLVSVLREAGVPHVHEVFEGTHSGTGWRYELSLPALVRAVAS